MDIRVLILMLRHLRSLGRIFGLDRTRCPLCGTVTDMAGESLCPACAEELRPRTTGLCPQCGIMYGDAAGQPTRCGQCRLDPPPWDSLHCYGKYTGKLRDMILNYKFNGGIGHTRLLADMAVQAFDATNSRMPDVIVPVPLHLRRLLKRGFNQSTELSRILGKDLGIPVLNDGLVRIRNTRPQTHLDRQERQTNIRDAFEAEAAGIGNKVALLVDDVYTTGATLTECAHTLKRAGVAGVDVLVLARTQTD